MPAALRHDVFQAIADPTRRHLLRLVAEEEKSVNELAGSFPISRAAVSKHLGVLAEAGLVERQKRGRERLYRLRPEPLAEVKEWLAFYEQFWDKRIARLMGLVEPKS